MARIKYASLVSDISGSIGSATFQKSLYGNTLRNRPRPRLSSSVSQQYCRGTMQKVHQAWSALTDAQRRQWNQYVTYNNSTIRRDRGVLHTGHSLFIRYNFIRYINLRSILSVPGYAPLPEVEGFFGVHYYTGDGLYIESQGEAFSSPFWVNIKISSPRPASMAYSPRGLRWMYYDTWESDHIRIDESYLAAFGVEPPVNSKIHYDGQYFMKSSPIISGHFTGIANVYYD